jgi:hypothetical protein
MFGNLEICSLMFECTYVVYCPFWGERGIYIGKDKGKILLEQTTNAQKGSKGLTILFI